jgi:hypothetical protein
MAIEIVSFPIKHGDFPLQTVSLPEGKQLNMIWVCLYRQRIGLRSPPKMGRTSNVPKRDFY